MREEEKWEGEAEKLAKKYYSHPPYRDAFRIGYLQACKVRQEEIEEVDGIILACYRAFGNSSNYIKQEAKRLAKQWVKKETK